MAHLRSFKAKLLRQFELEESRLRAASSVASETPLSPRLPEASVVRFSERIEQAEASEHATNVPTPGRAPNHQPSSPTSAAGKARARGGGDQQRPQQAKRRKGAQGGAERRPARPSPLQQHTLAPGDASDRASDHWPAVARGATARAKPEDDGATATSPPLSAPPSPRSQGGSGAGAPRGADSQSIGSRRVREEGAAAATAAATSGRPAGKAGAPAAAASAARPATDSASPSASTPAAAAPARAADEASAAAAAPAPRTPAEPARAEAPLAAVELLRAGAGGPEAAGDVRLSEFDSSDELLASLRSRHPGSFVMDPSAASAAARLVFEDAEGDLLLLSPTVPWAMLAATARRVVVALPAQAAVS